MCGIAGFTGTIVKSSAQDKLRRMLHAIEHRGPDSRGEWYAEGFSFGMQRLSIIDLAGGDQPIWGDRGCGIVFNGEIYNYRSLRTQLENKGVKFKTHSDTEVVVKLYELKGINCLKDLEGMFSFCIFDPVRDAIVLVRDRFGVKPLYYSIENGELLFSSETKSLIRGLDRTGDLRLKSLYDYLTYRFIPNPHTAWEKIEAVQPGTWLEWSISKKTFQSQNYWSLRFHSEETGKSDAQVLKEFNDLFLAAVEKRLMASDVPVGILLSGGLDSSAVAAAAAQLGHKDLHSFSIGFDDERAMNELPYARLVAKHIGTNHHEITIGPQEFASFFDDFTHFSDEPLADLASIALYYVSRLAREHVKVVLAGEGADEIFAGYNFDKFSQRMSVLRMMRYFPKRSLGYMPFQSARDLGQVQLERIPQHQKFFMTNVFSESEKKELWLGPKFPDSTILLDQWYDRAESKEPLDRVQQVYCGPWLVDDLLMKADKMSMATSLEMREPFLDHTLAEWAARLPTPWKTGSFLNGFTTKKVLRDYAKNLLPREIIERPKQGFPVPANLWLQDKLKDWAYGRMHDSNFLGLISKPVALRILDRASGGDISAAPKAWTLLVLASWMKRWL